MQLRQLFDPESATYTYLIFDPNTRQAALIDPVREQIERDLKLLSELELSLTYVLETHVHADHVTAAGELARRTRARTVASYRGAPCADVQVRHGDTLKLGDIEIRVLETPGHTDDSLSFVAGGNVFTGDALLIRGTGRTDFQNGDPHQLYQSITQVLFALPDETVVWPAHDYKGLTCSTIGEEKRFNPRVAGKSEAEFVTLMNNLNLPRPKKIDEAVPLNRQCGLSEGRVRQSAEAMGPQGEVAPHPLIQGASQRGPIAEVTAEQVARLAKGARLIDVREPHEFCGELGHLPGAELVPLAELERAAQSWDRETPIVCICRSGGRSARACELLVALGFRAVVNLAGGMQACVEAGLPVDRTAV